MSHVSTTAMHCSLKRRNQKVTDLLTILTDWATRSWTEKSSSCSKLTDLWHSSGKVTTSTSSASARSLSSFNPAKSLSSMVSSALARGVRRRRRQLKMELILVVGASGDDSWLGDGRYIHGGEALMLKTLFAARRHHDRASHFLSLSCTPVPVIREKKQLSKKPKI